MSSTQPSTPVAGCYASTGLEDELRAGMENALAEAKARGASAAEAVTAASRGLSVNVRLDEVETVEHTRDRSFSITVYFGQRSGSASTSDMSAGALRETVAAACSIARHTAQDPCAGLADPERMATGPFPDLDLHHPWDLPVDQAVELARACEQVARDADPRIVNSEGAGVGSYEGIEVYGNSHGFMGTTRSTRHNLSCSVVARDKTGMQRDHWYSVARSAADLEDAVAVGKEAARRTLARLDAHKLSTRRAAVLYEAPVASSLIGHFVAAVRGSSLYRRASFLLDRLDSKVFADGITLQERPHLARALGSAVFDNDGVATADRDLVTDGVLRGYVLDAYSARRLGMQTTGNAGGVHNLSIVPGAQDFQAMLAALDTGLLVTELIGFGVNTVTGDYSRGAAGFWVENGRIQYPVEEITVAGNLAEMFTRIAMVGCDVDPRRNLRSGSLLVEDMAIAGS